MCLFVSRFREAPKIPRFINRLEKAAVSTRRRFAAALSPLSSDPFRRPSEEQEETSWDIFTVETTHGGI